MTSVREQLIAAIEFKDLDDVTMRENNSVALKEQVNLNEVEQNIIKSTHHGSWSLSYPAVSPLYLAFFRLKNHLNVTCYSAPRIYTLQHASIIVSRNNSLPSHDR